MGGAGEDLLNFPMILLSLQSLRIAITRFKYAAFLPE
jgi:hypothetical protein